jgi:hypothetical protein
MLETSLEDCPSKANTNSLSNDSQSPQILLSQPRTSVEVLSAWSFQVFGTIVAVLFGVYTVLAYYASQEALSAANISNGIASQAVETSAHANNISQNEITLAMAANQIYLLGLCKDIGSSDRQSYVCNQLQEYADMNSIAMAVFPGFTATSNAPASATTKSIIASTASAGTATVMTSPPTTYPLSSPGTNSTGTTTVYVTTTVSSLTTFTVSITESEIPTASSLSASYSGIASSSQTFQLSTDSGGRGGATISLSSIAATGGPVEASTLSQGPSGSPSPELRSGAIVGIILGVIGAFFIAFTTFACWATWRRMKAHKARKHTEEFNEE